MILKIQRSKLTGLHVFFFSLLFWQVPTAFAQEKFTLSGIVSDIKNNETLIGASIYIDEINNGTATNEYGFYSISLPEGSYTLKIDYVGYSSLYKKVVLNGNTKLHIAMDTDTEQLSEVVIIQNNPRAVIRKPEMSVNKMSINEIKKMPVVMGESDILKSILLLPGVTNAGEGASGFNVRGGSAGQNLIQLDEASVYNSSHLFGFFSVFNSDAIKDLKLYKGGIPARFGGRASSVLDIFQKNGNSKEFHATGGIGTISSRLLLEGPIEKDRASFLIAGRGSYAHLFLKLTDMNSAAYFYDLNTKLNYKINDNNNLYLSGYFGRDVFKFDNFLNNQFGNTMINLRWNHLFNDQLFANASVIYSDYYYGLKLDGVGLDWDSGIKNYNFKYDLKHYLSDKLQLNYGINAIYYDFNPGKISPSKPESSINERQLEKKHAFEPSVYLEAEQQLSEQISVNYGLRYSMFYRLGAETVNIYAQDQAVDYDEQLHIYSRGTPSATRSYSSGQTIKSFQNFEPRFSISYAFNDDQSVKASYNRMSQYLHLISNTSSPTPLDIWAPSDAFLKPELVDQVALGYFRNFAHDKYSLEVETYYKKGKNKIDYIDGADLIANEAIEQIILNGESRAYGLEVMFRKNSGRFTGWVSYTLSKSEQRTPGRTAQETGINQGQWYRSAYDKTHDLSLVGIYELNKKWLFSASFALQSGRPVTYPNGQYEYLGVRIPSYDLRNKNSLPLYHHLDISATYVSQPNKEKGWQGEWVFGIYNLYGRKNAASINFRESDILGQNEAVKLSIFGIVPSVTYNFKF
ncbi:TonB-dependent receptor [Flavobacterium sp. JP2137]|uniref:TonB-dependent receptor n=1 Tax=Flavobacterium sp. JP2137 TaxID=3414510 RepID=UPI003D2FCE5A